MKALILDKGESEKYIYRLTQMEIPEFTGPHQAKIKILCSSLNRRDVWMKQGLYPGIVTPCILGSDACGIVESVSDPMDGGWIGKIVVVNPGKDWGEKEESASPEFTILGMPNNGTFADYVIVSISQLYEKPAHLSIEQAACLGVAGGTAFRACITLGGCCQGKKVLVTGIGGGVSQFAAQICVATGADVWVTSSSQEKIDRAIQLFRVSGGFVTKTNWTRGLSSDFDLIVDGTGGDSFGGLIALLKLNGRLVCYGATSGNTKSIPLPRVFLLHLKILGATMASDRDFQNWLNFISEKKIYPHIHSIQPFSSIIDSLNEMKSSSIFGKLIISNQIKSNL